MEYLNLVGKNISLTMLNIYTIFLHNFQAAIKNKNTIFMTPANIFVKKILDLLLKNNIIQNYILKEDIKKIFVYLHQNKILKLSNFLKSSNKKFFSKIDLLNYNKKYKNEKILILSNDLGLTLNTNTQLGGMCIIEIILK